MKPYVKSNKNDTSNTEAIYEVGSRPTMWLVAPKAVIRQDLQGLHWIRQQRVPRIFESGGGMRRWVGGRPVVVHRREILKEMQSSKLPNRRLFCAIVQCAE
ncbi:MAG: hypothetical protein KGO52_14385 [Nitrospirota bacterium]|nr:hypothetical protein [Nitrospirota bacterium]